MTTLDIEVPADEPIIVWRRFFQAPPELVYATFTEPEHVRHWWGPRKYDITVCEADLRIGGAWRVVHRGPDGTEHAFHGTHLELDPPRRVVRTFVYEGFPEEGATEEATFEPAEGGTLVVAVSRMPSFESRAGALTNGMEEGGRESYERLDELLASLQS